MKNWNINRVIRKVNTKYGAPMGRNDVGNEPITVVSGNNNRICKRHQTKVYDKRVVLIDGYDNGGAYWGFGKELRVRFTADLSFINFYRLD